MKFREEISGCILIEIKSPLVIFVCHGIHHQCHFHASQLDISISKNFIQKTILFSRFHHSYNYRYYLSVDYSISI